jgi:hypothetical protein
VESIKVQLPSEMARVRRRFRLVAQLAALALFCEWGTCECDLDLIGYGQVTIPGPAVATTQMALRPCKGTRLKHLKQSPKEWKGHRWGEQSVVRSKRQLKWGAPQRVWERVLLSPMAPFQLVCS